MNSTSLTGRIATDPVIRMVKNGEIKTASFTLATKDRRGRTSFPRVDCLGKNADFIDKYMKKGRRISVLGSIMTNKYQNKNGETVYSTYVLAESVEPEDSAKPTESVAYTEEIEDDVEPNTDGMNVGDADAEF